MLITVEELKRLEEMDIRDLKREDLDNAGDIVSDRSKPAVQRMREFLEKTKNPYAENVGDYILMVTFSFSFLFPSSSQSISVTLHPVKMS